MEVYVVGDQVIELYSKDSKLFTILYLTGESLLISPCEAVLFW